ncbi:multiprotein bridging factor aMBF1 [Methanobrevibacter olleyae]|uniref:Putative transcription factor n=1 Tax=Methanobrevibacter olleyae TaxID=294671 RepID=A0A126R0B1_METOL|nr:multiprotein bridging factor aMBF1 [Methanobrevibacter olleyae]AMK15508.1 transcriptional regulator [Methanobrevibacter olleyae]SFL37651.1 putative transcription factor [Methanobrevibacter olleyae]
MNCEICGKPMEGKPIRTKIDGSVLEVCKECSKFGRVQKDTALERKFTSRNKKAKKQNQNKPQGSRGNIQRRPREEAIDELAEDYSSIIRKARESRGWTREELGAKIYEKVSVINRIESGKMEPDLKLAKKFEKTLNIALIEKYDAMDLESFKSSASGPNTLGSVVKIKRK